MKPVLLQDPVKNNLIDFIFKETNIKISMNPSEIDPKNTFPSEGQGQGQSGGGGGDNSQSLIIFTIISGISILLFLLLFYTLIINWWSFKKLFGFLSFLIYGACAGGTIFCVLNESSFFYPRGANGLILFYPSFQHQTVLEGWMASSMMLFGGLSLILLHEMGNKMENSFLKKFLSTLMIWLFWCCTLTLVMFFTWKNMYYMSNTPLGPYLAILRDLFGKVQQ
jgi:hypothetical protein